MDAWSITGESFILDSPASRLGWPHDNELGTLGMSGCVARIFHVCAGRSASATLTSFRSTCQVSNRGMLRMLWMDGVSWACEVRGWISKNLGDDQVKSSKHIFWLSSGSPVRCQPIAGNLRSADASRAPHLMRRSALWKNRWLLSWLPGILWH